MRTRINLLTTTAAILLAMAATALAKPEPKPAKPTQADQAKQAEEIYQQGRDALLTGEYDKAVTLLTKAVAADKIGKTSYRLALARAYRYSRRKDRQAVSL